MAANSKSPYLLEFPKLGNSSIGFISVLEGNLLPFKVMRVYWTYYTPESVSRGFHAHHQLDQILIAVSGKIEVRTEGIEGKKVNFTLDKPNIGIFLPRLCWHEMSYTHSSVQICLANMEYTESDYIRDYQIFKKIQHRETK